MTSTVSLTPTIRLVILQAEVIILTPIIAPDASTVVHIHALEIVSRDSSDSSIPIIVAMAIAREI